MPLALTFAKRPFAEQVDFFRGKINLPTNTWRDIQKNAHDRAFVVAGATAADLLTDLREAVDGAIAGGETLEDFRKRFDKAVAKHGWDYRGERNWRTRVIYQTNMATSYAAGRLGQLRQAADDGLWWMYRHNDSVQNPRPLHVSWDGYAAPASSTWWQTHYPPNDWGCHCYITAVHPDQVKRRGGRTGPAPDDGTDPKTGTPAGIGEGWDYMPGARADEPIANLIEDKLIRWDADIGSTAFAAMTDAVVPAMNREFGLWADGITRATGQTRVVGALSPAVTRALRSRGIAPASAHLAVRDADVLHTHRDTKAGTLPWAWYRELPAHLARPVAVLLDKSQPEAALLYVFDVGGKTGKVVVRLDYEIKRTGADGKRLREVTNILRTGKLMDPKAFSDPVTYEVLEGKL